MFNPSQITAPAQEALAAVPSLGATAPAMVILAAVIGAALAASFLSDLL